MPPPTVAQTAPAFADPAAEASAGFGLNANAAWRAEYEDRRVLLPPLPPVAQDFLDELHGYKNFDVRAIFQQLDDEWTRRVLLPAAPAVLEDWFWSLPAQAGFAWLYAPQTAEQDQPSQPPSAPSAFDDGEGSRDFTEKRFWLESDVLLGVPFTPPTVWLDDSVSLFARSAGSLAAMVLLDEFVNAPSAGGAFGPAPLGHSARFGFSISSFR